MKSRDQYAEFYNLGNNLPNLKIYMDQFAKNKLIDWD